MHQAMTPGTFGVALLVADDVVQVVLALIAELLLQVVTQGQGVVDTIVIRAGIARVEIDLERATALLQHPGLKLLEPPGARQRRSLSELMEMVPGDAQGAHTAQAATDQGAVLGTVDAKVIAYGSPVLDLS